MPPEKNDYTIFVTTEAMPEGTRGRNEVCQKSGWYNTARQTP